MCLSDKRAWYFVDCVAFLSSGVGSLVGMSFSTSCL
jgi:presenilin-like A22 family membrane protease